MNRKSMLLSPLASERGVALPVALFGLVAVSLLVTAALLTSSNEVALSRAHQDGTRSIHAGSAALEEFVASRVAMTVNTDQRLTSGPVTIALATGEQYIVTVAELYRGEAVDVPGGALERRETYSLVTQPVAGFGRGVGALVEAVRAAPSISFTIDSGLTLGTDATITGNATISDGSDSATCVAEEPGAAIRYSSDAEVTIGGAAAGNLVGDTVQDSRTAAVLMSDLLNGHSIDELSDLATIRFGPMFDQPAFASGSGPIHTSANPDLRWGCPIHLVTSGCTAQQAAHFPTVVIDAHGGTASISNWHGQGILIVRNGDLHISGSFQYAGVILVEGNLKISGGGGASRPNIEGAVVAMGDEAVIDPGDESEATGSSVVRFNRCEIASAQRGLTIQSLDTRPQTIDTPTFAWFEVIR